MKNELEKIRKELFQIQSRNKRVETEKAWKTSTTRWVSILVVTYILATIVMYYLNIERPIINVIIPTLGYFLSVQSLPFIKKLWIRKNNKDLKLADILDNTVISRIQMLRDKKLTTYLLKIFLF